MSEEYESEIYSAGSIEKPQFIKGDGLDMPLLLQKFSEHFNEIFRTTDGTMDTKFVEKHRDLLVSLKPSWNRYIIKCTGARDFLT